MKNIRNRAKEHPTASLYIVGALLLFAGMLLSFLSDSVLYAAGVLRAQTITLNNTELYSLVNMTREGDTLISDTGDAQLLLQPGQHIRTLHLTAEYETAGTNEMDLYYHLPGGGFSAKLRVWPTLLSDGENWEYHLPAYAGQNIRLDLADQSGVKIKVVKIVLNERPAWYRYFIPTLWQLLWLAVVPGLAACAAAWGKELYRMLKNRRRGNT